MENVIPGHPKEVGFLDFLGRILPDGHLRSNVAFAPDTFCRSDGLAENFREVYPMECIEPYKIKKNRLCLYSLSCSTLFSANVYFSFLVAQR